MSEYVWNVLIIFDKQGPVVQRVFKPVLSLTRLSLLYSILLQ